MTKKTKQTQEEKLEKKIEEEVKEEVEEVEHVCGHKVHELEERIKKIEEDLDY